MSDLRITLVQADQIWKNKLANLSNFDKLLENCLETDLIILPEMFHTSFCMDADGLAEEMKGSIALKYLSELAAKNDAAVYTSFIAIENEKFYNRGVFVFPDGGIETYDKRKLFSLVDEDTIFTAGTKETIVTWKSWKINLQVCYDLRFPEISLNKIQADGNPTYHLSIYVANWPTKRIHHWNSLLPARAIENQAYVIGLNRVGVDGLDNQYAGNSGIWNPLGEKITDIEANKESIEHVVLSKKEWENVQERIPFIKDRI